MQKPFGLTGKPVSIIKPPHPPLPTPTPQGRRALLRCFAYLQNLRQSQLHCLEPFAPSQREQAGKGQSPHPFGLPPRSHSHPLGQCPRHQKCLLCSNRLFKMTRHIKPLRTTFTTANKRDRIEKTGELWELCRDCGHSLRSEALGSTIISLTLNPHRVGGGSTRVL